MAVASEADILGFGGSAGGGKSDLLMGLALTAHKRSIIYRREGTQLTPVKDRISEILHDPQLKLWNGQDERWRFNGKIIELKGVKDLGTEKRYQGRAHDLKGFDEVTEFAESQVRFLMGWLRSPSKAQRCRIVMGFNPPTTEEGRWIVDYFGPWLDDGHPNPAEPGELRWYTTDPEMGKDMECPSGEPIRIDGDLVQPLSRTFIPSRVEDNVFYMESGYKAVLQALPEPLRSQMLKGDFNAGVEDNAWQVIPTQWVREAQERWTEQPEGPMDSLGVDPARGGADRTALVERYGRWYSHPHVYPGQDTPDGPAVAALCVNTVRDAAPMHVDVIGVGGSVVDHLAGLNIQVVAINASEKTDRTDKSGKLRMGNLRAAQWWGFRESLDPANGDKIQLPPDDELRRELCTPRFHVKPAGIYIESKVDIIKRVGRSPDKAEAAIYAAEATRKEDSSLFSDIIDSGSMEGDSAWMS